MLLALWPEASRFLVASSAFPASLDASRQQEASSEGILVNSLNKRWKEYLDETTGDVEAEYMQRLHRTRQAAETAECCASLHDEPDIRVFFLMSPQNFMRVEFTVEARAVRLELPFKDIMNGVHFFRGENPEDVRMLVRFQSAPREAVRWYRACVHAFFFLGFMSSGLSDLRPSPVSSPLALSRSEHEGIALEFRDLLRISPALLCSHSPGCWSLMFKFPNRRRHPFETCLLPHLVQLRLLASSFAAALPSRLRALHASVLTRPEERERRGDRESEKDERGEGKERGESEDFLVDLPSLLLTPEARDRQERLVEASRRTLERRAASADSLSSAFRPGEGAPRPAPDEEDWQASREFSFQLWVRWQQLLSWGVVPSRLAVDRRFLSMFLEATSEDADLIAALDEIRNSGLGARMGKIPVKDPVHAINNYRRAARWMRGARSHSRSTLRQGGIPVLQILVTPLKVLLKGVSSELGSRLTRQYAKEVAAGLLVRVAFAEEDGRPMSSSLHRAQDEPLEERMRSIMLDGLSVGHERYRFFAASLSQLREGSCWMIRISSNKQLSAEAILSRLGVFDSSISPGVVTKRLGICFSSTLPTVDVRDEEMLLVPDVTSSVVSPVMSGETQKHTGEEERRISSRAIKPDPNSPEFVFTDGSGTISLNLWRRIVACLPALRTSSAFQIRLGGIKGMLVLHPAFPFPRPLAPRLKHLLISQSMYKFHSRSRCLEINDFSRRFPYFLNRQVILLLDTLGVGFSVFDRLQQRMLQFLRDIDTRAGAVKFLLTLALDQSLGTSSFAQTCLEFVSIHGVSPKEPFLRACLEAMRNSLANDLRKKTRIFVEKGANLFGVPDFTHSLAYDHGWRPSPSGSLYAGLPEVFLHVTKSPVSDSDIPRKTAIASGHGSMSPEADAEAERAKRRLSSCGSHSLGAGAELVQGVVAVCRNPCLFPGDIQLCYAVGYDDLPEDSPLRRSLASGLGGDAGVLACRDVIVFPSPPLPPLKSSFAAKAATSESARATLAKNGEEDKQGGAEKSESETDTQNGFPPLHERHPAVTCEKHARTFVLRDVPNMLSGGDLDGDKFWVAWDPDLLAPLVALWTRGEFPKPSRLHFPPRPPTRSGAATEQAVEPSAAESEIANENEKRDADRNADRDADRNADRDAERPGGAKSPQQRRIGDQAGVDKPTEPTRWEASGDRPPSTALDSGQASLSLSSVSSPSSSSSSVSSPSSSSCLPSLASMVDHFIRVQKSCVLGRVSKAHMRLAHRPDVYTQRNWRQAKALHPKCLKLAALATLAVDAPQTGAVVVMPQELACRQIPHFMATAADRMHKQVFHSDSILGRLFDAVTEESSGLCKAKSFCSKEKTPERNLALNDAPENLQVTYLELLTPASPASPSTSASNSSLPPPPPEPRQTPSSFFASWGVPPYTTPSLPSSSLFSSSSLPSPPPPPPPPLLSSLPPPPCFLSSSLPSSSFPPPPPSPRPSSSFPPPPPSSPSSSDGGRDLTQAASPPVVTLSPVHHLELSWEVGPHFLPSSSRGGRITRSLNVCGDGKRGEKPRSEPRRRASDAFDDDDPQLLAAVDAARCVPRAFILFVSETRRDGAEPLATSQLPSDFQSLLPDERIGDVCRPVSSLDQKVVEVFEQLMTIPVDEEVHAEEANCVRTFSPGVLGAPLPRPVGRKVTIRLLLLVDAYAQISALQFKVKAEFSRGNEIRLSRKSLPSAPVPLPSLYRDPRASLLDFTAKHYGACLFLHKVPAPLCASPRRLLHALNRSIQQLVPASAETVLIQALIRLNPQAELGASSFDFPSPCSSGTIDFALQFASLETRDYVARTLLFPPSTPHPPSSRLHKVPPPKRFSPSESAHSLVYTSPSSLGFPAVSPSPASLEASSSRTLASSATFRLVCCEEGLGERTDALLVLSLSPSLTAEEELLFLGQRFHCMSCIAILERTDHRTHLYGLGGETACRQTVATFESYAKRAVMNHREKVAKRTKLPPPDLTRGIRFRFFFPPKRRIVWRLFVVLESYFVAECLRLEVAAARDPWTPEQLSVGTSLAAAESNSLPSSAFQSSSSSPQSAPPLQTSASPPRSSSSSPSSPLSCSPSSSASLSPSSLPRATPAPPSRLARSTSSCPPFWLKIVLGGWRESGVSPPPHAWYKWVTLEAELLLVRHSRQTACFLMAEEENRGFTEGKTYEEKREEDETGVTCSSPHPSLADDLADLVQEALGQKTREDLLDVSFVGSAVRLTFRSPDCIDNILRRGSHLEGFLKREQRKASFFLHRCPFTTYLGPPKKPAESPDSAVHAKASHKNRRNGDAHTCSSAWGTSCALGISSFGAPAQGRPRKHASRQMEDSSKALLSCSSCSSSASSCPSSRSPSCSPSCSSSRSSSLFSCPSSTVPLSAMSSDSTSASAGDAARGVVSSLDEEALFVSSPSGEPCSVFSCFPLDPAIKRDLLLQASAASLSIASSCVAPLRGRGVREVDFGPLLLADPFPESEDEEWGDAHSPRDLVNEALSETANADEEEHARVRELYRALEAWCLPSWHLAAQRVTSVSALRSFLEDNLKYPPALLPATLVFSNGSLREQTLDLDFIRNVPETLERFRRLVATLKRVWDAELTQIMVTFAVESEAEILTGFLSRNANGLASRLAQDEPSKVMKSVGFCSVSVPICGQMERRVQELRERTFRVRFYDSDTGIDYGRVGSLSDRYDIASAAYYFTHVEKPEVAVWWNPIRGARQADQEHGAEAPIAHSKFAENHTEGANRVERDGLTEADIKNASQSQDSSWSRKEKLESSDETEPRSSRGGLLSSARKSADGSARSCTEVSRARLDNSEMQHSRDSAAQMEQHGKSNFRTALTLEHPTKLADAHTRNGVEPPEECEFPRGTLSRRERAKSLEQATRETTSCDGACAESSMAPRQSHPGLPFPGDFAKDRSTGASSGTVSSRRGTASSVATVQKDEKGSNRGEEGEEIREMEEGWGRSRHVEPQEEPTADGELDVYLNQKLISFAWCIYSQELGDMKMECQCARQRAKTLARRKLNERKA
ncbi:UNVERIFIED_CONTAM: RNA-dependent RNA polymerase RDP [Hammondia hammondi]|eukprot:XP_008886447.1 RNA-dependent RNA polymerase RDP [Hammondia hammondi]